MSIASEKMRRDLLARHPRILAMLDGMAEYERDPRAPKGTYKYDGIDIALAHKLERGGFVVHNMAGKVRLSGWGREVAK